jgi:DNA polymerase I-like protein with 3'-5' exonuclease and polymerase domains
MPTFAIDFETFYSRDCSITVQGLYHYLTHPQFDAYLVSVVGDDGTKLCEHPSKIPWARLAGEGSLWISHNAAFDAAVYAFLRDTGVVPNVNPEKWHCSADLSAFLGAPRSLKEASATLLRRDLSKDVRDKMRGKNWNEMDDDFKNDVIAYALDDSTYCLQIWKKYSHLWPEWERKLSDHTRLMGWGGVPLNKDAAEKGIRALRTMIWEAEQQIPWVSGDEDGPVISHKRLAEQCAKSGIECPKSLAMDSEECTAWEDTHGETYPWVSAMRQWRRCNMLLKKLENMATRVRPDGRMGFGLKYFGSHTGRWSGDAGVNMQNLPRGEMFGVSVRHLIEAPANRTLVTADLSQIEPRCLAWMAGDESLLEIIRNSSDFYEAQARAWGLWTEEGSMKENGPSTRHMVKQLNLGLGYGMSAAKFSAVANMDMEEAERLTNLYRYRNPKILNLWKALEANMRACNGHDFELEMPSGRLMRYRNVSTYGGLSAEICQGGRMLRRKFWGGSLCENLIQSAARDVFANRVLAIEEAGYDVINTVHDEVIIEADENIDTAEIELIMATTPEWMPGLPVMSDVKKTKNYTK